MAISEDDRVAYLAGEDRAVAARAERAELDELRELLATEATWVEPDPGSRIASSRRSRARRQPPADPPRRRSDGAPRVRAGAGSPAVRPSPSAGSSPRRSSRSPSCSPAANRARRSASRWWSRAPLSRPRRAARRRSRRPARAGGSSCRQRVCRISKRPLLRGVAEERRRRAGARRDVQRRQAHDAVGGCPADAFPGLTVTRQRADGKPASSGERVLTGTIRSAR